MGFGKAKSQLITIIEVCNESQVTNRCYTFRLPKGIWHSSTPANSIQVIILWYSKSNIFLNKLLAHSEEATNNCRWFKFCMDSSKIWYTTGNSVIGPLMLLIYIYGVGDKLLSFLQLFGNDSIFIELSHLWKLPNNYTVTVIAFLEWTQLWQMNFNIRKCTVLQYVIEQIPLPILANYSLVSQILEYVKDHSYLGIILDQQMIFTLHTKPYCIQSLQLLNAKLT